MRTGTICLAALAMTLAPAAMAQTTVYKGYDANTSGGLGATSEPNSDAAAAAFRSTLSSGVATESFEGFPTYTSAPLTLNFTGSAGSTLTATLMGSGDVETASQASPTSSGQFAVDGSNYYQVESSDFGVTFGSPIAAFAFYATDIESDVQIILSHAGGTTETYGFAQLFGSALYGNSFTVPSGSVNFLGFVNTADPFTSITFGQGTNSGGDVLAFDEFTIADKAQVVAPPTSAVPEPGVWASLMVGFGLIGGLLRTRRRVAGALGRATAAA